MNAYVYKIETLKMSGKGHLAAATIQAAMHHVIKGHPQIVDRGGEQGEKVTITIVRAN